MRTGMLARAVAATAMGCAAVTRAAQSPLPLERITLPAGVRDRARRARAERARDDVGRRGARCSWARQRGQRLRGDVRRTGSERRRARARDRAGPARAGRRRVPRRRALRVGGEPHPPVRRHRGAGSTSPPAPVVVTDRFPTDGHHGRKFIAFGPDGKLYVPVGAPCNICEPDPDRYANDHAHESGRQRPRGRRARRAQLRRLRLGSADARSCGSRATAAT